MPEVTPYANSVFEQPWWLETVAPGKWGEIFVKEDEEIVARMPYVLDRGKITMPRFTQTLGPWIKREYRMWQPGNTQLSKQKEIVHELVSQLPKHKSFDMRFDSSNDYILPYRWLDYQYIPTFSYRIANLTDIDSVYRNFNKTVKKNIRYAANKTHVEESSDAHELIWLYKKTFEQQNRNIANTDAILKIVENAFLNNAGKVLIAKDNNNNPHSGAFLLYDEKVCYYLIGGSDAKYRSSGSQSLVLWESIRFAAERSKAFDFEGSNIESIENFFRQFSGERVINYNVFKRTLVEDCFDQLKPRVKKILGYKM